MQQADATTTAALAAGERTTAHSTRLGGTDVSTQVQSWQLERSYATDLPPAMRAFAGSSAAQLQLQVSGRNGTPAPTLYAPWADRTTGDVARPGQSVVQRGSVGSGAALPAFRGTVRARSAQAGTDTVQLTALDGAERLRGPALLPKPYAGFRLGRPVATATWCVDELLRQAGVYSSPPPRYPDFAEGQPLTLVHATLHGGFATPYGQPETLPEADQYTWTRDSAPHAMALLPLVTGVTASWFPRSRVTVPGSRLLLEAWVNPATGPGDTVRMDLVLDRTGGATGTLRLQVNFATGQLTVGSGTTDGAFLNANWNNITSVQALKGVWHIGVFIDTVTTGTTVYPTVQPRLTGPDGTVFIGSLYTITNDYGIQPASELRELKLVTDLAVEGIQLTSGLTGMPNASVFDQSGTWTKAVELDDAVLPLYSVPRVSGSQWEVVGQIAKASMSTAEFDERGVFRWRNHTRFATAPTAADLTLTSVRDIASLTLTEEIDACRNYVSQPAKIWEDFGVDSGTTYSDTVVRTVPANGTLTVSYVMADEEFDIGPPSTDDDSVTTAGSQVRFATTRAGSTAVKGAVDVLTRREDGYLVVRFTNRTAQALYTAKKDGTGSVYLETLKPRADPEDRSAVAYVAGTASERFYGRQEHTGDSTDWIQDLSSAQAIADTLYAAGAYPVPVIGDVEVLYDPRVQLGDVIRLTDASGTLLDTLAWVIGISTTAAADGGVQQILTLRGTRPNGTPADNGLTPDAPAAPPVVVLSTYAAVTAAFPTLSALTASGLTWGEIMESAYV
ncbi:hypothetical protein AB0D74_46010 [Streptomyces sp. NPDC048278]|uniref:hypothetical protein n=1 Tax=Streptomyces sp. NPDC048278 TaxID=3155809 RepID=UPI00343FB929